jgi:hypothetical protein
MKSFTFSNKKPSILAVFSDGILCGLIIAAPVILGALGWIRG